MSGGFGSLLQSNTRIAAAAKLLTLHSPSWDDEMIEMLSIVLFPYGVPYCPCVAEMITLPTTIPQESAMLDRSTARSAACCDRAVNIMFTDAAGAPSHMANCDKGAPVVALTPPMVVGGDGGRGADVAFEPPAGIAVVEADVAAADVVAGAAEQEQHEAHIVLFGLPSHVVEPRESVHENVAHDDKLVQFKAGQAAAEAGTHCPIDASMRTRTRRAAVKPLI